MKTDKKKIFGYLYIIDAYGCTKDIDGISTIYDFLVEAVATLGVSQQAPPYVFHSPSEAIIDGRVVDCSDKAGISAWVPLLESGIQCHTLTKKKFISIDFYSCSVIDSKMATKLFHLMKRSFDPKITDSQIIERGVDYYS